VVSGAKARRGGIGGQGSPIASPARHVALARFHPAHGWSGSRGRNALRRGVHGGRESPPAEGMQRGAAPPLPSVLYDNTPLALRTFPLFLPPTPPKPPSGLCYPVGPQAIRFPHSANSQLVVIPESDSICRTLSHAPVWHSASLRAMRARLCLSRALTGIFVSRKLSDVFSPCSYRSPCCWPCCPKFIVQNISP